MEDKIRLKKEASRRLPPFVRLASQSESNGNGCVLTDFSIPKPNNLEVFLKTT
jgi:hypothetical protein